MTSPREQIPTDNAVMTLFEYITGRIELENTPSIESPSQTFLRIMNSNTITHYDFEQAIIYGAQQTLQDLCAVKNKWSRMTIFRMKTDGDSGFAYITALHSPELIPIIVKHATWTWYTLARLPMWKVELFVPWISKYMTNKNDFIARQSMIEAHGHSASDLKRTFEIFASITIEPSLKYKLYYEVIAGILVNNQILHPTTTTTTPSSSTCNLFNVINITKEAERALPMNLQHSIFHLSKVIPNAVDHNMIQKLKIQKCCCCDENDEEDYDDDFDDDDEKNRRMNHSAVHLLCEIGKFYQGKYPPFLMDYCKRLIRNAIEVDDVDSFDKLYTYCLKDETDFLKTDEDFDDCFTLIREDILMTFFPKNIIKYCLKEQLFNDEDFQLALNEYKQRY